MTNQLLITSLLLLSRKDYVIMDKACIQNWANIAAEMCKVCDVNPKDAPRITLE